MNKIIKIDDVLSCVVTPYLDIDTTVYAIKTDCGAMLFDVASSDDDFYNAILPLLKSMQISRKMLKYVFISHNHRDHVGGLKALAEEFPQVQILSRDERLCDRYGDRVRLVKDGEVFLNDLQVVAIPGHTMDSAAILDRRTMTLITGDSLQSLGIFGKGKWGANISFPAQHLDALEKLRRIAPARTFTAHDYHPQGRFYHTPAEVNGLIACCAAPLDLLKDWILADPDLGDEAIAAKYNAQTPPLPTLGTHVVEAIRKTI